ncbi:MAG: hypothetical protein PVH88_05135 [Ignavibacteria bacterium]|jgi:hypothetical protein
MVEYKKQFSYFKINTYPNIILTVKIYKEGKVMKHIRKLESLSNIRIALNPHRTRGDGFAFIPLMCLLRGNRILSAKGRQVFKWEQSGHPGFSG